MLNLKEMIKKIVFAGYNLSSHFIPVKNNVIMFESSNGRNYTGNPRYIYEEMVNQGLDKKYKCVWSVQNLEIEIPGNCLKIKRSRAKFLYYSLRSRFWIFDSRHQYYLKKNKNTKYIQTWHGTPLKKLALDMDKVNMSGHKDIEEYKQKLQNAIEGLKYTNFSKYYLSRKRL